MVLIESLDQISKPPMNEEIALAEDACSKMCKYYMSQKQNGFNHKRQWYHILITFEF